MYNLQIHKHNSHSGIVWEQIMYIRENNFVRLLLDIPCKPKRGVILVKNLGFHPRNAVYWEVCDEGEGGGCTTRNMHQVVNSICFV